MKKPSRFLRLLGIAGLLAMLMSATFSTALVQAGDPDPDPSEDGEVGDIWDGTEPALQAGPGGIYFAWVGNNDESTGLGAADTSTSVQNLTNYPAVAFAFVGGLTDELGTPGGWNVVGPFFLAPWASKTFTADQLGITDGSGAPVAFSGYNLLMTVDVEGGEACAPAIGGPLAPGVDANGDGDCTDVEQVITFSVPVEGGFEDVDVCVVNDEFGNPAPFVDADENVYEWDSPDDVVALILDGVVPAGLNHDGDCSDSEEPDVTEDEELEIAIPAVLGGYAKQAVTGDSLPYTTTADSSVSGYNAAGGIELGEFDDWYLPIVQTNCGPGGCWNSVIRIANFGQEVDGEIGNIGSAAVTISVFPADDAQGSLDTGFQLQTLLNAGDAWTINLSDYVPEGFVGSAHIYSDSAVFAMVDRVKVGYSMWLTTTGSNAPATADANFGGNAQGSYLLFAPDVRLDFFGWNTGINVANLVNDDNNVNVQYFNSLGNSAQTLTRRLAPQGMTYVYDPSIGAQDNSQQDPTMDVNADVIGSALIWSEYPVAVAVDATKYPESTTEADPNIFQGFTYNATANVYNWQAFPLVQKGNPVDGMGATSGIQILNPNNIVAQAVVYWVNPSGFGASNFGQTGVAVPAYSNGFVYTMNAANLPNGFYGSAVLYSTYPVAAITTQVDYQVAWDGTAAWNAYNPCGYYRDAGEDFIIPGTDEGYDCNLGDPFAQPEGGSVKKTFVDENGDPVAGVYATLYNEVAWDHYLGGDLPGTPWTATGQSDVNGEILWTNVPEGNYWVVVDSLPTVYSPVDDADVPHYADPNVYYGDPDDAADDDGADTVGWFADYFELETGEDELIENELDILPIHKIVDVLWQAEVEVCLVPVVMDEFGDFVSDTDDAICQFSDDMGIADFGFDLDIPQGYYYVTVNAGLSDGDPEDDSDVDTNFLTVVGIGGFPDNMDDVFVPELFEEGGLGDVEFFAGGATYLNEFHITKDAGRLRKVFTFDLGNIEDEELTNVQLEVNICYPDDECALGDTDNLFHFGPDDFTFDDIDLELDIPEGTYQLCYGGEVTFTLDDMAGTEVTQFIEYTCEEFEIVADELTELFNDVVFEATGIFDAGLWVCNDQDCLFDWIFDLLLPGPPPIVDDGAALQGEPLDPEIAEVCLLEVVDGTTPAGNQSEEVVDCTFLNFSDFIELCATLGLTDDSQASLQGQGTDIFPLIDCEEQGLAAAGSSLQQSPPILPGVFPVWFAEVQFDDIPDGTYRLRATNQTFDDDVWLSEPFDYTVAGDIDDGFLDDNLYWPFQAPFEDEGRPDGNIVAGWSSI